MSTNPPRFSRPLPLLIDVDGVAADFLPYLLQSVAPEIQPSQITQWDLRKAFTEYQWSLARKVLSQPDFWVAIPVHPEALVGVQTLRRAGHLLHWVTTPWYGCNQWGAMRRHWLKVHFGADPADVTITEQKHLIHGAGIIDDNPDHVNAWLAQRPSGIGYLFDHPYNRRSKLHPAVHRVTWQGLIESEANNQPKTGSDT